MKRKTFLIICAFLISAIAALAYKQFNDGNGGNQYFGWGSGNQKNILVNVTTGKAETVPFEFSVGDAISEMRLEIKDDSLQRKSISLEKTAVRVRNGIASSKVIFNFKAGAGLRAGHYEVTIIARDAASGKVIRTGAMPFAIDMLDLIWKCSC